MKACGSAAGRVCGRELGGREPVPGSVRRQHMRTATETAVGMAAGGADTVYPVPRA